EQPKARGVLPEPRCSQCPWNCRSPPQSPRRAQRSESRSPSKRKIRSRRFPRTETESKAASVPLPPPPDRCCVSFWLRWPSSHPPTFRRGLCGLRPSLHAILETGFPESKTDLALAILHLGYIRHAS